MATERVFPNRSISFFNLAILLLSVCYYLWLHDTPLLIQSNNYIIIAYVWAIILFFGHITAMFGLRFAKNVAQISFLFIISLVIFIFNTSYVIWNMPIVANKIICNKATFSITFAHEVGDYQRTSYRLSKWQNAFNHRSIYFGNYFNGPFELICDETNHELRVMSFDGYRLYYSDSTESRFYEFEDSAILNEDRFSLQYYDGTSKRDFFLTICKSGTPNSCTLSPIDPPVPLSENDSGNLIINKGEGKLYILFNDVIYSVYGDESLKFEELASADTGYYFDPYNSPFREEYHLSSFWGNGAYSYILYACNTHGIGDCWHIPLSYSTKYREDGNLTIDKATDRVDVYIGGKLIFTYKGVYDISCQRSECSNYQCFAEGCEILDQK